MVPCYILSRELQMSNIKVYEIKKLELYGTNKKKTGIFRLPMFVKH